MDTRSSETVVISFPADLSIWGRQQIDTPHFRAYLKKTLGQIERGDEWEEFVGVGCCGNTLDVPLRIEQIDGDGIVGPDTEIEYVEREACGIAGGWLVQSAGGPTV